MVILNINTLVLIGGTMENKKPNWECRNQKNAVIISKQELIKAKQEFFKKGGKVEVLESDPCPVYEEVIYYRPAVFVRYY